MIKIQHRRGTKARLPSLSIAELGFTTDTNEVFIGGNNGNVQLATLDENGKIPTDQMPSNIPTLGEDGKIPPDQLPEMDFYTKEETLENNTKTLFGLDVSALPDDIFKAIKNKLSNLTSKSITLVTGKYTGTGVYGESNPTKISCPYKILFWGVIGIGQIEQGNYYRNPLLNFNSVDKETYELGIVYGTSSSQYNSCRVSYSEDEKEVSFWYDRTNTNGAEYQLNQSMKIYDYFALCEIEEE